MTVSVIGGAFLFVGENFVRFRDFLELLFRRLIVRVYIGVVLSSHLPIGSFDLFESRRALYPQHFIIISLIRHHLPPHH
jgi:hypothetical protein